MTSTEETGQVRLERGLGLKEATALNMIDMVGIGPFIVIPFVIQTMGGPQCMVAWVAGALLSLIDGCVWSELGAAMPRAGGSYFFLRECYGPGKWGRLMSFLFIWQTMIQAPLVIASGSIGFSKYLTYLVPVNTWGKEVMFQGSLFGHVLTLTAGDLMQKGASGLLVILIMILLYRRVTTIGKISVFLWVCVVGTIAWLIFGGATHFNPALAFDYPPGAWDLSWLFWAGLGQATVKTIYSYLGYYNVCHLGGEVRDPVRIIPRSIFISIIGIAILYLSMQLSVLGVVPWREAMGSEFIVSTFVERIYGSTAATIATGLILCIAFSSLFAATLGYSRIPYAAATDGTFFKSFAKLHPTKHFPHISLLALCSTAFVFSLLFRLGDVIDAILAMRILVQFIGQAVGVMLLHKRYREEGRVLPFRMLLYPLPALLGILAWAAILISTGAGFALAGSVVIALGVIVYMIRARALREWPFAEAVA
jgi:amino acid transporter